MTPEQQLSAWASAHLPPDGVCAGACEHPACAASKVLAMADEARGVVAAINNEVFGSDGYFTEPRCVDAVRHLKSSANAACARWQAAEARLDDVIDQLERRTRGDVDRSTTHANVADVVGRALDADESVRQRYSDLILQVVRKYSGESRHDTAKRYIKQAEEGASSGPCKAVR